MEPVDSGNEIELSHIESEIFRQERSLCVAQAIISEHEIGKTFAPVRKQGVPSRRSLAYVKAEDLDSFFPSRDKLFILRQVQNAGHRSQVAGHRSQVTGHRSQVAGHRSQVSKKKNMFGNMFGALQHT